MNKKVKDRLPSDVCENGMVIPIRWTRNAEEQKALHIANGGSPAHERASTVAIVGATLLLVLALVRIVLR